MFSKGSANTCRAAQRAAQSHNIAVTSLCFMLQVVKWRAALSQLSGQGAAGLPNFRQYLQDPTTCADTLDVVFEAPALGQTLISYGTTPQDTQVGSCNMLKRTAQ
jgi:hypothetical protein